MGAADDDLSWDLQSKTQRTLHEAVTLSRQAEARMESQSLLRRSDNIPYILDRKPIRSQADPPTFGQ